MDGDEVDGTARAVAQELVDPIPSIIRDGRRAQLGLPGEGLQVLAIQVGGVGRLEVGLGAELGLVEGEKVRRAVRDPGAGVVHPRHVGARVVAPEHRDVLSEALLLGRVGAPVVLPGDLAAGSAKVLVGMESSVS